MKNALFVALCLACSAWIWSNSLLVSRNTLFENDHWIVQKRMMQVSVMGADEFLLTRAPLAGDSLDLGAYHGYQQVVSRESFSPTKILFRFQIPKGSYLDFSFAHDGSDFFPGLLLGQRGVAAYHGTEEGAILEKHALEAVDLTADLTRDLNDGWHRAKLERTPAGQLRFYVDGVELTPARRSRRAENARTTGRISFRGGRFGARIDDVVVECDGRTVLRESFSNSHRAGAAFLSSALILLLIVSTSALIGRVRSARAFLFHGLAVALVSASVGGAWLAFDFGFWAARPSLVLFHRQLGEQKELPNERFERLRLAFFDGWGRLIGEVPPNPGNIAQRGYPVQIIDGPIRAGAGGGDRDAKRPRLLFVGTSQTIGSGARTLDETFFVRTLALLREKLPASRAPEGLNIAVSGSSSQRLLADIKARYRAFLPGSLAVVNLSSNDTRSEFRSSLSDLVEYLLANGARVVLVEEANDRLESGIVQQHRLLEAVASEHSLPVLKLHEFLNSEPVAESGFLFWDLVHLTSYGQELTAKWLAPRLLELLD